MNYKSTVLLLVSSWYVSESKTPKITIVLVVDQFAHHEFQKIIRYCNGGMRFLYDNGINYLNAFQAQGTPVTGAGHAALSTGAYATDHGIVGNFWITPEGKKIKCDSDEKGNASPVHIMVDTLSDQLILNNSAEHPFDVCAISLKSRAAIMMAGRLGKPFWFNKKDKGFISSPYYGDQLPQWLIDFNTRINGRDFEDVTWNLLYPSTSPAYQFVKEITYQWVFLRSLIHRPLEDILFNKVLGLFQKTPAANELLFDCAHAYITHTLHATPDKNIVLWLGLSSLDKVGHLFGPDSFEVIDMLYQLDQQLGKFMKKVEEISDPQEILWLLTADHGIAPILNVVHEEGYTPAQRISLPALRNDLNAYVGKEHHIHQLFTDYKSPALYLNEKKLAKLTTKQKNQLFIAIKNYILTNYPGIARVWTFDELQNTFCLPFSRTFFMKQQLYPGRSGQLILEVRPYVCIDRFKKGAGHGAPYDYDMHVPLIICRSGILPAQTIVQSVYAQQIPVTLAALLNVPRPSASTFDLLPGI
ncbi:MAG: alkaline phosphatase family protein [Candidatus Babeliaceae bacterium]